MLTDGKKTVASDFFSTITGRWMQEDVLQNLTSQLRVSGDSVEPTDTAKLFLAHKDTLEKMLRAIKSNEKLDEALRDFRTIPEELKTDRRYLVLATNIAGRISEAELSTEVARFKKHISDESMLDHIMLGLTIQQGNTDEALRILQRIDEKVGGDVFLNLCRANAYLASNRVKEADDAIERVRLAMPDVYAVIRTAITIASRKREFANVTQLLRDIESKFGQTIDTASIIQTPELSEYAESDEFFRTRESTGLNR